MADERTPPIDDDEPDNLSTMEEAFSMDDEDSVEEFVLSHLSPQDFPELISDDMEEDQHDQMEEKIEIDQCKVTFTSHQAPVFCCDIHLVLNWVVSGGEDDCVYLWDRNTAEIITCINDHRDTVIAVQFNNGGDLLASVDMSGIVLVHRVLPNNTEKLSRIWLSNVGDTVWSLWHPNVDILAVGCEDGKIVVLRFPTGECKILSGNQISCHSGVFTSQGKHILAGYGDGTIKLWDIKTTAVIMNINSSQHNYPTTNCVNVATDHTGNIFAAGNDDGKR